MLIQGTNHSDVLFAGNLTDDVFRGFKGVDFITGWDGNDTIYGGAGGDVIRGCMGNDADFGGHGNDVIYDTDGWNQVLCGTGNDYAQVLGVAVGGKGADDLWSIGGATYGDEGPGLPHLATGADHLSTFFVDNPWLGRTFVGGGGADTFFAGMDPADNVGTRLDVLDFTPGTDKLHVTSGVDEAQTFAKFDTDHNGVIDGKDPWTADVTGVTGTWSDPNANATVLYDHGDLVAVWGTQHLAAHDFIL